MTKCGARLFLVAAALALLAPAVAPAHAAAAHVYSFAISGPTPSEISQPAGIAVDNSNGPSAHAVYVTDPENHRVVKFDASGAFLLMFGDGVNKSTGGDVCTAASAEVCGVGLAAAVAGEAPGSFREPSFIAVDGSAGASAGDVYVADQDVVMKFDESGVPIASWGTGGTLAVDGLWIPGLAVAPGGAPVVLTVNVKGEGVEERLYSRIHEFDQTGGTVDSVGIEEAGYNGLAIDLAGNRYLVGAGAEVDRISPAGATLGRYEVPGQAWGLALDRAASRLYVSRGDSVIGRYSTACAELSCDAAETFGNGDLVASYGARALAVDDSTHTVFAANSEYWGDGEVGVFRPEDAVPEAATGIVTRPSRRTAVLEGVVGPAAGGSVTGCRFEYVDRSELEQNGWTEAGVVPCAEAPPYAGSRAVTAPITDFEAGRIYLYRVVAENAAGKRTGLARRFESGSLIEAATGAAESVSSSEATLTGFVDPDPNLSAVNCFFEFFEEGRLGQDGWREPRRGTCSPAPPYAKPTAISARVSRLEPGKAYRYRIVAWDSWGASIGAERTFVTPPQVLSPEEPAPVPDSSQGRRRKPGPRRAVRCSRKACSRELQSAPKPRTWISPRFPDAYGWRFSVFKKGKSLHHTKAAGGCISTFSGRGMIATLNGCDGHFKLTYIGRGRFTVRWRVFEYCRCADSAGRRG